MIMMMVSNGSQSGYRLKISSHRQTGRQLCNLHHVYTEQKFGFKSKFARQFMLDNCRGVFKLHIRVYYTQKVVYKSDQILR